MTRDVADVGGPTVLLQTGDAAPPFVLDEPERQQARSARPAIVLAVRADINEDHALEALAATPDVFVQDRRLVQLVNEDRVHPLCSDSLVPILTRAADFYRLKDGNHVPAQPPTQLVRSLAARGSYPGVRVLDGVTRTPILRLDGSVCTARGYDPASRLVYQPVGDPPPIVARPSRDDAVAAIRRLLEPVAEVAFLDAAADRSAWLSLVLSLAARSAIGGSVPMFLATANQARTGKTRTLQIPGLIVHGALTATTAYPMDEEELRKRIDAFVFGGAEYVVWDNIRGAIGGPAFEAVLTTSDYQGRVLGTSTIRTGSARTVWAASANGATVKGDMAGRTLPIRLHCDDPHPELRTFRIRDLTGWVAERRAALLGDAITVVRAYLLADRPDQDLAPWGSFEAWSGIIRGALVWAGMPDPIATREEIEAIDAGASAHERLVWLCCALWPDGSSWTAGHLAERVDGAGLNAAHTIAQDWTLADARDVLGLLGAWDRTAQRTDRIRLGRILAEYVDRPTSDGARIGRDVVDGRVRKSRTGAPFFRAQG